MLQKLMIYSIGKGLNILGAIAPTIAGKVGFTIFCKPFSAALKPYQTEFLNTAEKFKVDVNGLKVQCYKWGNGCKNILFIHGWASHSFRWKQYIETFKEKEYTIYAFDSIGHGASEGKYLNLIVNAETIQKVTDYIGKIDVAVCHSFGGFSVIYLLHHFPQTLIQKTVVMGAPGEAKHFFDFYRDKLKLTNKTQAAIIERFKQNLHKAPEYFSSPAFAKSIQTPCLIIHDKNDDEAPIETALLLHQNWKGSKMIVTEGLGHHLKSKKLIDDVVQFAAAELP